MKHLEKNSLYRHFFEAKREEIEGLVRPIDTVRSTKEFAKEYED